MSDGVSFPGESSEYREHRNRLLQAEVELRAKVEQVAALRRQMPLGGVAQDYVFDSKDGAKTLSQLFEPNQRSLILYSFMYGPDDGPCPMCSAFMDSLNGQIQHVRQRTSIAAVTRSSYERTAKLAAGRGWGNVEFVSAANNSYATDYRSEMPNGAQVPMCNVFVKTDSEIRHFWNSELFFAPSETQPRHIDTMWPLWSFFDITPDGRGDFMPQLKY